MSEQIADLVRDIPPLRGVFVTAMPDCLLYDSWIRESESWVPEEVAVYFGDLVRANREGLKALRSWSAEMQVTIESADVLLILREITGDFVIGIAFERQAPLGMVRIHVDQIIGRLTPLLPTREVAERKRAVSIVEFLERYAPDPHAVLSRVALMTRIPRERLAQPDQLDDKETILLEEATKDILGLEQLTI